MFTLLSSRSANLSLPTIPSYGDDVEWVTAYLVQHMLSHSSWVYAWILWIAIGAIFMALTVMHWAGFRGGYLGALWSKWALRRRTWRKKRGLAAAERANQPYRQPMALPSNAQILTVCGMFVGVLALSFVGPDYIAPDAELWNYHNYPVIVSLRKRVSYDTDDYTYLQPQFTIWKGWWTTGGRTGLMAFALFPLVVVLALKTPPFAILSSRYFLQLGFDKLSFLHRWCGFLIWSLATLHTAFWSVQLARDHRTSTGKVGYVYAWQYEKFIFAWIAYGCFTLLMICALPAIRRHHYEAFYFLHVLFVPLTLVMSALHHPPLAWWCWAALALWVAERSYRLTWWLNTNGYFGGTRSAGHPTSPKRSAAQVLPDTLPMHVLGAPNALSKLPTLPRIDPNAKAVGVSMTDLAYTPPPGYAHAELMPGKTVRLRIVTPGFLSWAPGQHFLIRLPVISNFTTHPFTVASVCDEQAPTDAGRELVFFIRAKKGWTKDLWDLVAGLSARGAKHPKGETLPTPYHSPPRGVLLRASVDGPFGSAARARWNEHSTVLLMVGGSGVSFALSVLEYVCMCLAGRDGKTLGGRHGGYGMPGYKTQRVRFVWIVREFGHVHWCARYLRRCMEMVPPDELQIDIFVTNAKPLSLKRHLAAPDVPLGPLAPPLPQFALESLPRRSADKGHRPSFSVASNESEEEPDNDVDLSYYESNVADDDQGELGHDEHFLDLTNFEDEDDTAIPGESQLNMAVKEEGRARRSFIRHSMALFGKQDLGGIRSSMYSSFGRSSVYGTGVRGSMYGPGVRSSVRLLDDAPSSDAMRALAPPEASTSRLQLSTIAPSPLSATTTLSTPTSAAPLLGDRDRDQPRFTFPPRPSARSPSPQRTSFTQSRAESPRPESTLSYWSNAHSLAALVSEAASQEQLRLELDEEEVLDISVVAERVRPGRPVFARILADEVERSKGPVIVGCCGPTSLNAVVRKNIAAQINPTRIRQGDYRGQISLVAEDFGY